MRLVSLLFALTLTACGDTHGDPSPSPSPSSSPSPSPSIVAPGAGGSGGSGAVGGHEAGVFVGGSDAGSPDAGDASPEAGTPAFVGCPNLPIPATCRGRSVVYREWGANAVGDGTYFADQAPGRLGFSRTQGKLWVVKFKTDDNTYAGRISAYGDATPGIAYIARDPCDPTTAIQDKTFSWGNHGGGMINFVVAKTAADAALLKTTYPYNYAPQLAANACYYAVFQNTSVVPQGPIDASFIQNNPDDCGANTGGSCYYLAFDMFHMLYPLSGGIMAGNVIPGFTK